MTVAIVDLIPSIRVETGDEDSSNYKWTDTQYRDLKIPLGLKELSRRWIQEYGLTGSGDSQVLNPTPSAAELEDVKTLTILCTALVTLSGERAASARVSYTYSNPAGRSDFTKITKSFTEAIKGLEDRISEITRRKNHYGVEKELDEAGVELKSKGTV